MTSRAELVRRYRENVPEALQLASLTAPCFYAWKAIPDRKKPGRVKKVACDPDGVCISPADPAKRMTFQDALNAYQYGAREIAGISLAFDDDLPMVDGKKVIGIDIDTPGHRGNLAPEVWDEAQSFLPTYAEWSYSGCGVHILIAVDPEVVAGMAYANADCREIFVAHRHLALTGDLFDGASNDLADRTETFLAWMEAHFPAKAPAARVPDEAFRWTQARLRAPAEATGSDAQVLDRLFRDPRYKDLYEGGGSDASSADFTLMLALARRTDCDAARVKRIMYASPRRRDKWDDMRGNITWFDSQLSKAIATIAPNLAFGSQTSERKADHSYQTHASTASVNSGTMTTRTGSSLSSQSAGTLAPCSKVYGGSSSAATMSKEATGMSGAAGGFAAQRPGGKAALGSCPAGEGFEGDATTSYDPGPLRSGSGAAFGSLTSYAEAANTTFAPTISTKGPCDSMTYDDSSIIMTPEEALLASGPDELELRLERFSDGFSPMAEGGAAGRSPASPRTLENDVQSCQPLTATGSVNYCSTISEDTGTSRSMASRASVNGASGSLISKAATGVKRLPGTKRPAEAAGSPRTPTTGEDDVQSCQPTTRTASVDSGPLTSDPSAAALMPPEEAALMAEVLAQRTSPTVTAEELSAALASTDAFRDYVDRIARTTRKPELAELFDEVKQMGVFKPSWLAQLKKDAIAGADPDVVARQVKDAHRLIYSSGLGFHEYADGVWRRMDDYEVKKYVLDALGVRSGARAISSAFEVLRAGSYKEVAFNRSAVFNFVNGTLELDTGDFRAASPDDFCSVQAPYEYDPAAECPRWLAFIDEITQRDAAKARLLQQAAGYVLFPDCSLQKCFFLLGDGANGKSVFLDLLGACVGEENITTVEMSAMTEPFQLIQLYSSLVNLSSETQSRVRGAEAVFKAVVVGDSVSACYKGKDFITFRPRAKLFCACNEFVRSSDLTRGFLRRIIFIRFGAHFVDEPESASDGKADKNLSKKLRAELPGIFNWILAGYRDLRAAGRFAEGDEQAEVLGDFEKAINPVVEFVETELADLSGEYPTSELYNRYKTWCDETNHHKANSGVFTKRLKNALAKAGRLRGESFIKGYRYFDIGPNE